MLVSVIIPVYHGEKYIKKLVNRCEAALCVANIQSNSEVIIIVDNPGETYSFSYDNVKMVYNEINYGIHYSRVKALKHSKGKYIHFLDQDDWISKGFYLSQLQTIKGNDVCVSNCLVELMNYNGKKIIYNNVFTRRMAINPLANVIIGDRIVSPGQCLVLKGSVPDTWLENIMHYNGADDYLLWMIMFIEKKHFVLNNKVLFVHKNTGNNTSYNTEMTYKSNLEMIGVLEKNYRHNYLIMILKFLYKKNVKVFFELIKKKRLDYFFRKE